MIGLGRRRRSASAPQAAAGEAGARWRHLTLNVPGSLGPLPGDRRVPGRPQPTGIEVEAWQPYAPGDDLRHLDWSAYSRLDALLVRRFTAEREVVAHVLLDASASMGTPASDGKQAAAAALALALAAIGVGSGVAVRVVVLRGGAAPHVSRLHRHAARLPHLAALLADVVPSGAVDLGAALGEWTRRRPERAAAFVVSDFLVDPETLRPAVHALGRHGHPVRLLQVLGASELHPETALDAGVLVDAESGATHAVALDADALARYHAALAAHQAALAALADDAGAAHAVLVADASLDDFVTGTLVERGVVRPRRA